MNVTMTERTEAMIKTYDPATVEAVRLILHEADGIPGFTIGDSEAACTMSDIINRALAALDAPAPVPAVKCPRCHDTHEVLFTNAGAGPMGTMPCPDCQPAPAPDRAVAPVVKGAKRSAVGVVWSYRPICVGCQVKWRTRQIRSVDEALAKLGFANITEAMKSNAWDDFKREALSIERRMKREESGGAK